MKTVFILFNKSFTIMIVFLISAVCLSSESTTTTFSDTGEPYYRFRGSAVTKTTPSLQFQTRNTTDTLTILYYGPVEDDNVLHRDMWRAANLALADQTVNLIPVNTGAPWGNSPSLLLRAIYEHKPIALIAGMDSVSAHIAEQIAAKTQLPLINLLGQDNSIHVANVPWVFSLSPGYNVQAPLIAHSISDYLEGEGLVVISENDKESQLLTKEVLRALKMLDISSIRILEKDSCDKQLRPLAQLAVRLKPKGIFISADSKSTNGVVHSLREASYDGKIFCGTRFLYHTSIRQVSQSAENIIFPVLLSMNERVIDYSERFKIAWGYEPKLLSATSYDAVHLIIEAARIAAIDKIPIRAAINEISPWQGVTGVVEWDSLGAVKRPVYMGTIENGKIKLLCRE